MPAPLSIIIPTLNAADKIGPTLASAYEAVQAGLLREMIFADGGSQDGIGVVANDVGAVLIDAPKGRGCQLAAGANLAKGNWLLFLHADTVLSENWTKAVRAHLNRSDKAAYFRLQFQAPGFAPWFVAGWANIRSRLFGLPYGDQGLLISARLYRACGGYPEIPLMEDVALARRLRGKLVCLPAFAITDAEKFQTQGWISRGAHNLGTLLLYFLGRSPVALAKRYNRSKSQ